MRRYFKIPYLSLLFLGIFLHNIVMAQESKKKVEGEIVMTVEELESLLKTIAEKRQEKLDAEKKLNAGTSVVSYNSNYPQGLPITNYQYVQPQYQGDVQEQIRQLNYKMDLLLMNSRNANIPQNYQNPSYWVPVPNTQTGTQTDTVFMQQPNYYSGNTNPSNPVNMLGTGVKVYEQTVYFAHNSTQIKNEDKNKLVSFLPNLRNMNERSLIILQGFASKVGSAYYNNQLSFNRADAVKQILVNNGIHPSQIITMFHGVDDTQSDQEARRVDITIQSYP